MLRKVAKQLVQSVLTWLGARTEVLDGSPSYTTGGGISHRSRVRGRQAGDCVAVCAACGRHVVVPPIAGLGPWLTHTEDCPRSGWPIVDATLYIDGEQATIDNWQRG